jgi:alkylation response protein AidB-like acyl-CoA dehydrogenase
MTTTQNKETKDTPKPETNNMDEQERKVTFTETALRLGGKSEDEAKRTGAVDRADEQVEAMFAARFKTVNSPIHKAVWEDSVPVELFSSPALTTDAACLPTMEKCLAVLRRHKEAKTIWDKDGKIAEQVLKDLADAGYWGMLIDPKYGGQGASLQHFMSFLSQVAMIDPTCAGLASVHGCIGAVDPVRSFGNEEQKNKFLPRLASGETLSAFALTEPNAGSDLTALRTTATLEGDHYVINGEKLFITNAVPGRTIGIVCLINGKPAALIAELPKEENENFQLVHYGLYALKHTYNKGLKFKNFKVPKENLLVPPIGDGLTVAYHGLNLGRLALCATASGVMRVLLANMLPWSKFRETYGHPIETRELVKRRIARVAGLITASDALVQWGCYLLDQGYRGELECIIAKIFGSEAEKETAIEHFMKTHGGRSFIQGHLFGDNVHDFLAPCIYEGEGEMLGMAFFKSLAKEHGTKFFEPVGMALQREGLRTLNPANPMHVWKLRNELFPYAFWFLGKMTAGSDFKDIPGISPILKEHVDFAVDQLKQAPMELSQAMTKHQLKLADRQCRIAHMSQRVQDMITILVTALYAHRQNDEVAIAAADILCEDLTRKLTGKEPSDNYFRKCSKLADMVIQGGFKPIKDIRREDILFSYEKQ